MPPRVVIDPGVLVSALIAPAGPPAALLTAWRDGVIDVLVSPGLLAELEAVLARPKFRRYISEAKAADYVLAVRREAIEIEDPEHEAGLTPDPRDDYLLALARSADAVLVSGDAHLTGLPRVMTPRALLDALQSE